MLHLTDAIASTASQPDLVPDLASAHLVPLISQCLIDTPCIFESVGHISQAIMQALAFAYSLSSGS